MVNVVELDLHLHRSIDWQVVVAKTKLDNSSEINVQSSTEQNKLIYKTMVMKTPSPTTIVNAFHSRRGLGARWLKLVLLFLLISFWSVICDIPPGVWPSQ